VDAPLNEESEAIGIFMEIPLDIDKELRFFEVEKTLKTMAYRPTATVSRSQSYFQIHTLALQFVIILKVNSCTHIDSAYHDQFQSSNSSQYCHRHHCL